MKELDLETKLVQIGNRSEESTGSISTPVYLSSTFRHPKLGESTGYDYSRTGNPTRSILEDGIARLENGDCGFACSSGMAAVHTVLSLFEVGDELLVSSDLYGGTYRLFEEGWSKWGIHFKYVDVQNIEAFEEMISQKTKAIFIETPTNPLMQEADLHAFACLAKENDLLLIVDNTFYTPIIQRPLEKGADIVIHSASKYLAGHNDIIAGLIVSKGEELSERIAYYQNSIGAILSPMDCWLLIRGMKTLSIRIEKHEENAQKIAKHLQAHEAVNEVLYPGRGGMISFRVYNEGWVASILAHLQTISFAESLGGVESLMTYPATQTHADMDEEVRLKNGICNRLLRLSVGIESSDDLVNDLTQSLDNAMNE
ncbi:methionine biosynthesis PLP-dependent protein [Texcoconibacillus texcoconensis]|nr:methionine biosynthesis PLP-dependent protein [Texcoconibacillus texcoconensis]